RQGHCLRLGIQGYYLSLVPARQEYFCPYGQLGKIHCLLLTRVFSASFSAAAVPDALRRAPGVPAPILTPPARLPPSPCPSARQRTVGGHGPPPRTGG